MRNLVFILTMVRIFELEIEGLYAFALYIWELGLGCRYNNIFLQATTSVAKI